MRTLHDSVISDLQTWVPGLPRVEQVAGHLVQRLDSAAGTAEVKLPDGTSLSWLFDARSGQLLATYPNGAHRIRLVATPVHP